jgi:hypothetical protein
MPWTLRQFFIGGN